MILIAYNIYVFLLLFGIFIFFLSYYLTRYVRNYSLRNNVVDVPNERSSHINPTPTGGGLAICISILFAIIIFPGSDSSISSLKLGLAPGVLVIGIVGWLDIHREVAVVTRALLYLLASVWAIIMLGGFSEIVIGPYLVSIGWFGSIFAVFAISWLLNLYNFMDGTDGLASVQAISTSFYGLLFFSIVGETNASIVCGTILLSCCAFLIWNWAPARIFMGDVGSCALGFTFGVLAVYSEITSSIPVMCWFVLLSIFIADSTFTLFRRMISGDTWYRAHNTHAYQRLVQMGMPHKLLATYVFLTNFFVLGPLAYLVWQMPKFAIPVVCSLYAVLFALWMTIHLRYQKFCIKSDS